MALRHLEPLGGGGIGLDMAAALALARDQGENPAVMSPLLACVRDGYLEGWGERRRRDS